MAKKVYFGEEMTTKKTKAREATRTARKPARRAKRPASNLVTVTMKLPEAIRLGFASIKTSRNAVLS